jgi:cyclopropane fatty-acyl-phospholipid synthase-like methyltransferase
LVDILTPAEERRIQSETRFWDEVYANREETLPSLRTSPLYDMDQFFNHLISQSQGKRILSIGGGIDFLAVHLATTGADVYSIDVSRVACERTKLLASRSGVKDALHVMHSSCEQLQFDKEFDLVISKGALHHINFEKGIGRIKEALVDGGVLIALEPICFSDIIGFFQEHFPFHPQEVVTPDEIKLSVREMNFLQHAFSKVEIHYFEFLSRPSITYVLGKFQASPAATRLKRLDTYLLKRIPFLRHYCQHGVIRATN